MSIRAASAGRLGNPVEGSGTITTGTGGFRGSYSVQPRFEEGEARTRRS